MGRGRYGGGAGARGGGGGAFGDAARSHRYADPKCARTSSSDAPKNAKSELGADAIDRIVDSRAPAKPTATIDTPADFTADACAIAVASVPPTVCTPSVSSRIVRGTPARAAAPFTTLSPSAKPPDTDVPPPAGDALSIADHTAFRSPVSGVSVDALLENSTMPI